jgi:hypothetical protein
MRWVSSAEGCEGHRTCSRRPRSTHGSSHTSGPEGCTNSIPPVVRPSSCSLANRTREANASIAQVPGDSNAAQAAGPDGRGEAAKDLEIVVPCHELSVLRRHNKRLPRFRRSHRTFLAPAARRLPRARWERFLVTPKTLLR